MALALALAQCMETADGAAQTATCKTDCDGGDLQIGENQSHWRMMFIGLVWLLSLACVAWMAWNAGIAHEKQASKRRLKSLRDVAVQSPVTYRWWIGTPRFTPLPDSLHGCWTTLKRWG